MNKKIIIISIAVLVLIVLITTSFDKYNDPRACNLPYSKRCTLVFNKVTKMVYLEVKHNCEEADCNGKKIDSSDCKSDTKTYFKIISGNDYKKVNEEISKRKLNMWEQTCDSLEQIVK